ncbi:MAG: Dockerin type domain, partial [Planctomycetota bacterium]
LTSPQYSEPAGAWRWVTDEPLDFTNWRVNTNGQPNEPNDLPSGENFGLIDREATTWNDGQDNSLPAYVIEWSADCNNDGIVDFGQIRDGTLADTNANNVPDCCESSQGCNPCPADVDGSGAVNGVDLAAILNVWGTSGGKYPGADVNQDGIVDGSDLAEVLNGWGACP